MPDDLPDVIPCEVDPAYECVRLGSQVPDGAVAAPPEPGTAVPQHPRLCPDGYVPRRRRRPPYRLEGKLVRPDGSPTHRSS
jgi:hypothetical protein